MVYNFNCRIENEGLCKGHKQSCILQKQKYIGLEMWANAQRDGRPAEHRWRPLFNAAKFADAHY